MYYSSGNYEAFARPKKPQGVDNKSAYLVGSGLAALAAAGGNRVKAAALLDISRTVLYEKMEQYQLK